VDPHRDDRLTLLDERRGPSDARLLRLSAGAAPGEIQPVFARLRRHGATVDAL
jgi:hypothetical protein